MKRHLFWIVELLIWLIILFVIASGIMLTKYSYKKIFNTYQIFLPDVDGLINGSPVKMMGIQIGYVNQINIVGNDVYVRFIITDPKVKIPYGSVATVEFFGLGGSKSLELYPPKTENNSSRKFIITQSPKRIHDSLGVLNQMFDRIVEITYTVSNFIDKVGFIKPTNNNRSNPYQTANKALDFANDKIDQLQIQQNEINYKIEKIKKEKKNGTNYGQN